MQERYGFTPEGLHNLAVYGISPAAVWSALTALHRVVRHLCDDLDEADVKVVFAETNGEHLVVFLTESDRDDNDWNIVALSAFGALHLVPFNINPHYKESDPTMAPGSETRDDRIREYHVRNKNAVVAIEEATMVRFVDGVATVLGRRRAKVFRVGKEPAWFSAGEPLPLDMGAP